MVYRRCPAEHSADLLEVVGNIVTAGFGALIVVDIHLQQILVGERRSAVGSNKKVLGSETLIVRRYIVLFVAGRIYGERAKRAVLSTRALERREIGGGLLDDLYLVCAVSNHHVEGVLCRSYGSSLGRRMRERGNRLILAERHDLSSVVVRLVGIASYHICGADDEADKFDTALRDYGILLDAYVFLYRNRHFSFLLRLASMLALQPQSQPVPASLPSALAASP